MIRQYSYSVFALAFLPVALILVLFGIEYLAPNHRSKILLKIAILINSSLVLVLGAIGCNLRGGDQVDCYIVIVPDITETPAEFNQSSEWSELEWAMVNFEYQAKQDEYNDSLVSDTAEVTRSSIEKLQSKELISTSDAEILSAYCRSRFDYYTHVIGGATCYTPQPMPEGKEMAKEEIITATNELRELYSTNKTDTPAYDTTLANLEEQLKLFSDKEDNAVLRQLLLDLADGQGGESAIGE